MHEDTNPHGIRPVRQDSEPVVDVIERAKRGLWSQLPPWGQALVAVAVLLGGGGGAVWSFFRPSVVGALAVETVENHRADIVRLETRMEAFEVQAEKNTARILDALKRRR